MLRKKYKFYLSTILRRENEMGDKEKSPLVLIIKKFEDQEDCKISIPFVAIETKESLITIEDKTDSLGRYVEISVVPNDGSKRKRTTIVECDISDSQKIADDIFNAVKRLLLGLFLFC